MNEKLRQASHLLQLAMLEIHSCGGCYDKVLDRVSAAARILDDLQGIRPRFPDARESAESSPSEPAQPIDGTDGRC